MPQLWLRLPLDTAAQTLDPWAIAAQVERYQQLLARALNTHNSWVVATLMQVDWGSQSTVAGWHLCIFTATLTITQIRLISNYS